MRRSADRILTTHTGSLPRPRDLVALLQDREEGRAPASSALSIVNDGEQGRVDDTVYVKDRRAPRLGRVVVSAAGSARG